MTVWDPLAGSRIASSLAKQIAGGDVAHAWLLLGPPGSGKGSAALAIAAAVNCEREPNVGCGRCSSCRRIALQRHPDVHHVIPEGPLIPVDVIREEVIPEATRSPFEGRVKVFVVEEAEKMNPAAQNALLKTLEEPTGETIFLLLSDEEDELLETIRSRCMTVRLDPVPEANVVELLLADGARKEDAELVARLSEGELERARRFLSEEGLLERRSNWLGIPARLGTSIDGLDAAAEILDEVAHALRAKEKEHKGELKELDDSLGGARGTAAVRNSVVTRQKRELRRLEQDLLGEALQTLASFYRDVLATRARRAEAVTNRDISHELTRWAESPVSDAALVAAIERCVAARGSLAMNANQLLAIEAALVELARLVPPA